MKIQVEKINPFGPEILRAKCPQNILDEINSFVDRIEKSEEDKKLYSSLSGNIPNLLLRDIENIFLPYDFCIQIGLKSLLEKLAENYSKDHGNYKLASMGNSSNDKAFKTNRDILYSDSWVNRYYSGDYTPIHTHGADISGIIFLKIPEKELYEESMKNIESQGKHGDEEYEPRDSGRLFFIYGSPQTFCENLWKPDQTVGDILIFPSWLNHLVYPQKTNKERRTYSFNMIDENEYYDRMISFYGDYNGD